MIRILLIVLITMYGCGKKGNLSLDGKEKQREKILNQERVYKF